MCAAHPDKISIARPFTIGSKTRIESELICNGAWHKRAKNMKMSSIHSLGGTDYRQTASNGVSCGDYYQNDRDWASSLPLG